MFFEVRSLTKRFGGITAIEDVDLNLKEGEIVGIIGPNGAGKTTLFNVVTGIYQPTGGKVLLEGRDITGLKPHQVAGLGISRTFQNIRVFPYLSALDNVRTACHGMARYGMLDALFGSRRRVDEERGLRDFCNGLLELVGLYERRSELAKNLPYGLQRRLEIARAVALSPKILLLDEPAAGMHTREADDLCDLIRRLMSSFRLSTLLIEHHMNVVMNLSQRVYVLDFGRLIASGSPSEIRSNQQVIKAYLGDDEGD